MAPKKCVYPAPTKDLIEYKGLLYYPPKKITNHVWIGSEATSADKDFKCTFGLLAIYWPSRSLLL